MKLSLFDYTLPEELIAQHPAEKRDASRLLVVNRADGTLVDKHFSDLPEYLCEGDVLVLNDSRVLKARLNGIKESTGARLELFLLKKENTIAESGGEIWECIARPAKRLKEGDRIVFSENFSAIVLEKREGGSLIAEFAYKGDFEKALDEVGHMPLPPYIKRTDEAEDVERYQTVYANELGSAAAPTAGLHFTDELLAKVREKGVETAFVTLHVGLGTFRPVQTEEVEAHEMHEEFYSISEDAAEKITNAKKEGRRVICVGTTSLRTIESAADENGIVKAGHSSTCAFFYPGSKPIRITDALITNFHLPKSTLLMLVSAFYDREKVLAAYRHAIENRYRFFSYGDAMLIL